MLATLLDRVKKKKACCKALAHKRKNERKLMKNETMTKFLYFGYWILLY